MFLCLLALPAGAQTAVTKYAAMALQIRHDCVASPNSLHCYIIGSAAVSRRPIYLVRVTAKAPDASPADSPRILVICRQHGDEPASTQAALEWLARCSAMSAAELRQALGPVTVYIVPMANPDGADKLDRFTGSAGDMNRDWGRFALPETRALDAACKQIAPSAVLDIHSWDVTDPFQVNSVEAGMVAASSGSGQSPQAALLLQDAIIKAVRRETGQTVSSLSYSPEADTRLCHRYFTANGTPAVLVETAAGACDSREAMQPRVDYALAALDGAIQALPTAAPIVEQNVMTPYLASADSLAGRVDPPNPAAIRPRPRFSAAQLAVARSRAVQLALCLYFVTCLVLAAACRNTLGTAWYRLCARRRVIPGVGYVSIRARRYPDAARTEAAALIESIVARRTLGMRCR